MFWFEMMGAWANDLFFALLPTERPRKKFVLGNKLHFYGFAHCEK
jgi:hypothetical protein